MNEEYLKPSFQEWMSRQKKSNGDTYKQGTVIAYTNALRSSSAKLQIQGLPETDLFNITSSNQFEEIYKILKAAPNFKEVDVKAGNKAYSNSLVLYSKFLREREEPSIWIFQGNPKYYDVIGAVNDLDEITWAVNQYQKQIKEGDMAYIWLSGPGGGIVAAGHVLCNPEVRQPAEEDSYRRSEELNSEPYLAVDIRIEKNLTESIVERTLLLADERTKKMQILTYPGATNFQVTKEERAVIQSLIDESYEHIPASTSPEVKAKDKKRYWIYAPGENSRFWEEFYEEGVMGIGWEEIGNLILFPTKSAIKEEMRKVYEDDLSYMNAGHATWQFANEMKIGDIVFVKKGLKKLIGRGVVKSDYFFDESREEYNNIRKVEWTHKGEWDHEGQIVMKTLTDITPYTDYYKKLESTFENMADVYLDSGNEELIYEDYFEEDFLSEVYISKEKYHTLRNLLIRKKNLILMGAPGVGKTFAAERLAYSIMGKKDKSRVQVVQFHQSYSYEDFIMGYRPNDTGFTLSKGPFYEFCKKA